MTRHEIAEKLRQLNRWRRGDDETLLMPDPAAIGRWIDAAADALEEQDKRAAELARVMTERDKYHGALIARHGGEPVAILAELDAERARVAELEAQIERNAWTISPAMVQARIEQLAARVAELEGIIAACLNAAPVGHIPSHTASNLPEIVADMVVACREHSDEREAAEARVAELEAEIRAARMASERITSAIARAESTAPKEVLP